MLKCVSCKRSVYPNDPQLKIEGNLFHKTCAKCADCGCQLSTSNVRKHQRENGDLLVVCEVHYKKRVSENGVNWFDSIQIVPEASFAVKRMSVAIPSGFVAGQTQSISSRILTKTNKDNKDSCKQEVELNAVKEDDEGDDESDEHEPPDSSDIPIKSVFSFTGGTTDTEPSFHGIESLHELREALKSQEGPVPMHLISAAANAAGELRRRTMCHEAEWLLRQALKRSEDSLGPNHEETLSLYHSLASLLYKLENLEEAESLYRKVIAFRRLERSRLFGEEAEDIEDCPDTLDSMNDLAGLLLHCNRLAESREMYEQVVRGREEVLGMEHPDTLVSVHDFALVMEELGEQDQAIQLLQRALDCRRRVLGESHADTLDNMTTLAELLRKRDNVASAEALYLEALAGYEASLGESSKRTCDVAYNLGHLYQTKTGELDKAADLYEYAANGYKICLGPDDAETIDAFDKLKELR